MLHATTPTLPAAPRALPEQPESDLDRLARDLIEANAAASGATRAALLAKGWRPEQIDALLPEAVRRATNASERKIERPAYDRSARIRRAADIIGRTLPGKPAMVMLLMARGHSKRELDDPGFVEEAITLAADRFAQEGGAA